MRRPNTRELKLFLAIWKHMQEKRRVSYPNSGTTLNEVALSIGMNLDTAREIYHYLYEADFLAADMPRSIRLPYDPRIHTLHIKEMGIQYLKDHNLFTWLSPNTPPKQGDEPLQSDGNSAASSACLRE